MCCFNAWVYLYNIFDNYIITKITLCNFFVKWLYNNLNQMYVVVNNFFDTVSLFDNYVV